MPMMQIKDEASLQRDPHSKAIVNVDPNAYNNYIIQRDKIKTQNKALEHNTKELNQLKEDVSQLKTLLETILDKINNVTTK